MAEGESRRALEVSLGLCLPYVPELHRRRDDELPGLGHNEKTLAISAFSKPIYLQLDIDSQYASPEHLHSCAGLLPAENSVKQTGALSFLPIDMLASRITLLAPLSHILLIISTFGRPHLFNKYG